MSRKNRACSCAWRIGGGAARKRGEEAMMRGRSATTTMTKSKAWKRRRRRKHWLAEMLRCSCAGLLTPLRRQQATCSFSALCRLPAFECLVKQRREKRKKGKCEKSKKRISRRLSKEKPDPKIFRCSHDQEKKKEQEKTMSSRAARAPPPIPPLPSSEAAQQRSAAAASTAAKQQQAAEGTTTAG